MEDRLMPSFCTNFPILRIFRVPSLLIVKSSISINLHYEFYRNLLNNRADLAPIQKPGANTVHRSRNQSSSAIKIMFIIYFSMTY